MQIFNDLKSILLISAFCISHFTIKAEVDKPIYNPTPIVVRLQTAGDNGLTADDEKITPSRIESSADAQLYIYPAAKPNGTLVMMCPGGAYKWLAINHEGRDMAPYFNSMGITYAILKYRMPNKGHDNIPLADAEAAMRYLRQHAGDWHADTAKIGVAGASAGGHLASTLATHYSSAETRPAFLILFYPVISMDETITHRGSRDQLINKTPTDSLITLYSNELQVTTDTPKAFIMASADDTVVPIENTLRYVQSLTDSKVPYSLHIYPTGGHGWGFRDSFVWHPQWTAELAEWLKTL